MASLCSSSAGGTRGCDWAIALQKTSEIGGGQKCKRKPNTLAKMFCEVVIWQNTEVVLGLGSSRQSSSFPQLQPCDPSCAPGPAGWSGAAPAGDVQKCSFKESSGVQDVWEVGWRPLCSRGMWHQDLMNLWPWDSCTSTLPGHDLKAKRDGPAQFFGRKAGMAVDVDLEW